VRAGSPTGAVARPSGAESLVAAVFMGRGRRRLAEERQGEEGEVPLLLLLLLLPSVAPSSTEKSVRTRRSRFLNALL